MNLRMKLLFTLFTLLSAVCFTAEGQTLKVVADKIVSQVGDKIILKSDINSCTGRVVSAWGSAPQVLGLIPT